MVFTVRLSVWKFVGGCADFHSTRMESAVSQQSMFGKQCETLKNGQPEIIDIQQQIAALVLHHFAKITNSLVNVKKCIIKYISIK